MSFLDKFLNGLKLVLDVSNAIDEGVQMSMEAKNLYRKVKPSSSKKSKKQ